MTSVNLNYQVSAKISRNLKKKINTLSLYPKIKRHCFSSGSYYVYSKVLSYNFDKLKIHIKKKKNSAVDESIVFSLNIYNSNIYFILSIYLKTIKLK